MTAIFSRLLIGKLVVVELSLGKILDQIGVSIIEKRTSKVSKNWLLNTDFQERQDFFLENLFYLLTIQMLDLSNCLVLE